MMQLPPLLPSLTLVEAAERKAAAATNPADATSAPMPKPSLPLLSGPEVLHALPNGKVGANLDKALRVTCHSTSVAG
jgi:hypothetical protein